MLSSLYNVIRHTAHQYCFARGSTQMPKTCTKFLFIFSFLMRTLEAAAGYNVQKEATSPHLAIDSVADNGFIQA